jgi:hypothetical protein
MSDELVVQEKPQDEIVPSFHAVAVNATEMAESKSQIKLFLEAKVMEIEQERVEMQAALEVALTRKWAHIPLRNQVRRIVKRKLYYDKLLAAMNAGFVIVPNMNVDVFAIRVKGNDPSWNYDHGVSKSGFRSASPIVPDEKAQELPVGIGGYQSPLVEFNETRQTLGEGDQKEYHVTQKAEGFKDIEFPLAAAHPIVMDVTNRAMVLKIFDRIGIVPQVGRRLRGDPIILGQIVMKQGWSEKVASFLIAWHLDMRTL